VRFELGEGIFDRIEIGTVGRQKAEFGATGLDSLPDAGDLVGGQIVHDDDVAWVQGWRQHLLDPSKEALSVHRPVQKHRCNKACKRESADKSDGFPMPVRNGGAATLALWRPATKACHLRRKTALIDKDQVFGGQDRLGPRPNSRARPSHQRALARWHGQSFLCV